MQCSSCSHYLDFIRFFLYDAAGQRATYDTQNIKFYRLRAIYYRVYPDSRVRLFPAACLGKMDRFHFCWIKSGRLKFVAKDGALVIIGDNSYESTN